MADPSNVKKWLLIAFVVVTVALCAIAFIRIFLSQRSHPSSVAREVLVFTNPNQGFRIRVQMFPEEGMGFALGAFYRFESAPLSSHQWKEIMMVRMDDPDPIPKDHIRFLSRGIAYVFTLEHYAVTTDEGKSWTVWYIVTDLPDYQHKRAVIREVQLADDGKGTMTLEPFGHNLRQLFTTDYGRHWTEMQYAINSTNFEKRTAPQRH
jgi:hypothetical protein